MARTTTDLDRVQGTWVIRELVIEGAPPAGFPLDAARITIDSDGFRSTGMGADYAGVLTLGTGKRPNAFDIHITEGHAAGTVNRGIYKLSGDTWTICLATHGGARPRGFTTRPGTGHVLEVLQRETSAAPGRTTNPRPVTRPVAAPPSVRRKTAGPPTVLDGEWLMTEAVFDGKPMAASMVAWCRRVTEGGETTVFAGPKVMMRARFTVDDPERPRTIDYDTTEGSHAGKAQSGLVHLDGDTLRINVAPPGRARPADFSSVPGDGRSYTAWRRASR